MERWKGRVALVTGASSGIGEAVAASLADEGMAVVACARRTAPLEKMARDRKNVRPYRCDLTKEDEIAAMFRWISECEDLGRVDVCVANAGVAENMPLLEGTAKEWRTMLDVNVVALCLCTQLSIKSMQKNEIDDGQIILLNSLSGHRVTSRSGLHFYSATKFAVTSLLEGFRHEIQELGKDIRITGISPGVVETGVHERLFGAEQARKLYAMGEEEEKEGRSGKGRCLQAEDVAEVVKNVLRAPRHVQVHDILLRSTRQTN